MGAPLNWTGPKYSVPIMFWISNVYVPSPVPPICQISINISVWPLEQFPCPKDTKGINRNSKQSLIVLILI